MKIINERINMFFRKKRLKKALRLIVLRTDLSPAALKYISIELKELGIDARDANVGKEIHSIKLVSKILGVIFKIDNNKIKVYYNKLWPLYKTLIKIANDSKNIVKKEAQDEISKQNVMFDEHMKHFDIKTFKVTNKING